MKQKFQFDIRSVLIVIFVVSVVLAIFSQSNSIVAGILAAVLLANFAGAVTALVVTFVLRFPRDGGFRDPEIECQTGDGNPTP